MKTIAIMQPTYLPWLGYFDMIDQTDAFVLLDFVQFDKRSWQQRNRIKTPSGELLLTIPVKSKGKYKQLIDEVKIDQGVGFQEKHLKSIEINYKKARYYINYGRELGEILRKSHDSLAELNIELITWLKESIGIRGELIRSSSLDVHGSKVELLVSICNKLEAVRYLSPIGSKGYIDENNLFATNGIELIYHNYQHPQYKQLHGSFIPHLSVLDLLLNEGERSLSIIRSGRI